MHQPTVGRNKYGGMAERLGRGLQIRLQRFNSASHLQFLNIMIFWGLILGLPLLAFGGAVLFLGNNGSGFIEKFEQSRLAAAVLTVVAWLWTAYECSIIGIDVFDMILLKQKTGGIFVWVLAAVLSYLTVIWMPKNLSVRALTGILMLIPAALFRTTRPLLPDCGLSTVHIFVVTAYIGAVIGMYGMFYPWRLETAMAWVKRSSARFAVLGGLCCLWGAALVVAGFLLGQKP